MAKVVVTKTNFKILVREEGESPSPPGGGGSSSIGDKSLDEDKDPDDMDKESGKEEPEESTVACHWK